MEREVKLFKELFLSQSLRPRHNLSKSLLTDRPSSEIDRGQALQAVSKRFLFPSPYPRHCTIDPTWASVSCRHKRAERRGKVSLAGLVEWSQEEFASHLVALSLSWFVLREREIDEIRTKLGINTKLGLYRNSQHQHQHQHVHIVAMYLMHQ